MNRILIALAFVLVAPLYPGHASAYCTTGSVYAGAATIRVVVHSSLASQLQHADGSVWTSGEVDRAMWFAISSLNESANADVPLLHFDNNSDSTCPWLATDCSTTPWTACYQDNTIVVVPSNCMQTQITGSANDAAIVHISRSSGFRNIPGNGVRQDHGTFPGADNFEMTILHEIGHGLGIQHPDGSSGGTCTGSVATTCPGGSGTGCAIMLGDRGAGYSALMYGLDDQQSLQVTWGLRGFPNTRNFEDTDLTSASFVEYPLVDMNIAGYVSLSSRPSGFRGFVTVAGLRRITTATNQLTGTEFDFTGNISWSGTPVLTLPTNGPVGAAETDSARVLTAHAMRGTADSRRYRRRLYDARTPFTSTTWTTAYTDPAVGAAGDVLTGGVSSAYHGASGAVVSAIRDDTGQVLLIGRLGSSWSNVIATGTYSYASPAVACTPTVCMLAIVEAMRPAGGSTSVSARLQWREFTWTQTGGTASWSPGLLYSSSWSMTGSISAGVVARSGGGYDFYVTSSFIQHGGSFGLGNPGTRTFAYRHTAGSTTMSLLLPVVSEIANRFSFSPAGGTGTYAETLSFDTL